MEKTTRYYIWRDIICDILTAIEAMDAKEGRVAAENRVPTFLIDLTDYGGDTKSKSSNEDGKKSSRGKKHGTKSSKFSTEKDKHAPQSSVNRKNRQKESGRKAATMSTPVRHFTNSSTKPGSFGGSSGGSNNPPVCLISK
jgi:hypothetical protein